MIELLITMTVMGLLTALTATGISSFGKQQQGERATRAVLWEVTVARSYALRAGGSVALVADEVNKVLLTRDEYGQVWRRTSFGPADELSVRRLDISTAGDSLAFSGQGVCLNCNGGGATTITVEAGSRRGLITTSVLGRAELVSLSRL